LAKKVGSQNIDLKERLQKLPAFKITMFLHFFDLKALTYIVNVFECV